MGCKKCGEVDEFNASYKWCKPCHVERFKRNFTRWTSGNNNIDNFVQEQQLKIDAYYEIIFEWIPYNQFSIIKKLGEVGFTKIYLAIWEDGPLYYHTVQHEYTRNRNKNVVLKYLRNSQNTTNEFLNDEV